MEQPPPIITQRLELAALQPAAIRAILRMDRASMAKYLRTSPEAEWGSNTSILDLRLKQMEKDPALVPWILRAMIHRESRELIGHTGFHTGPNPEYLRDLGLSGIEYGYTVFEPYRRQGYATEASAGLMRWACEEHGICDFVLSIAPHNEPSLRIARGFGFTYHSVYEDPADGTEHIYIGRYDGA